jgi:hypothetical protein
MAVTGPIIPKFFTPSGSSASHPISIGQFEQGEIFICLQTGRMWFKGRNGASSVVRAVVPDIPFLNPSTSATTTSGMRASTVGSGASEVASAELYGPIKIADSIRIPSLTSATAIATNADGQIVAATGLAPTDAQYIVLAANAGLSNERVLTAGNHVTVANSGGLATVDWNYNANKRATIGSECNNVEGLTANISGTGATVSFTTVSLAALQHCGIGRLTTGTTTTGRAALSTAGTDSIVVGSGAIKCTCMLRVPTLSITADAFLVQFGLFDNLAGASTDAIYFSYTHGTLSGDWAVDVLNNGSVIGGGTFDTNVAVVANQWYRLEIEINADGTQALFKIDGTLVATVTNNGVTGNLPSGTARATGFGVQIRKTAGANARNLDCDYVGMTMEVTR